MEMVQYVRDEVAGAHEDTTLSDTVGGISEADTEEADQDSEKQQ